jgi:hypothetical protein
MSDTLFATVFTLQTGNTERTGSIANIHCLGGIAYTLARASPLGTRDVTHKIVSVQDLTEEAS